MSTQGDWPPDPDDRSHQRDPWEERPAQKRGMSAGAKVLIVLLSLAGVVVLLCCGVGLYIFASSERHANPEVVREKTAEILEIDVPEAFVPREAVHANLIVWEIDVVMYALEDNPRGKLVLGKVKGPGMDQAEMQMEMRRALGDPEGAGELTITRSETREFEIRGEEVSFLFGEATDEAGNEYRVVRGSFPTDDGQGFLSVQIPPENYDEDVIVDMIESIR